MKDGEHPHTHVGALEKELESVRERYRKRLAEAENETDKLRKEILSLKSKEAGKQKFVVVYQRAGLCFIKLNVFTYSRTCHLRHSRKLML